MLDLDGHIVPKISKNTAKSRISDNMTDKIDTQKLYQDRVTEFLGDLVSLMLVCLQMYV